MFLVSVIIVGSGRMITTHGAQWTDSTGFGLQRSDSFATQKSGFAPRKSLLPSFNTTKRGQNSRDTGTAG
jgi:hypothetical protein